jgi:hypothetical protein
MASRQIGVFAGSALNALIAWVCIRWIHPTGMRVAFAVGALWLGLTFGFEVAVGRMVLHVSWARVLSDYDLLHGGLLPLGLVFLVATPALTARWRRLF